jgi:NADPH:quinone reductase
MTPVANVPRVEGHAWIADDFGAPADVLKFVPRTWDPPAAGALLVEVNAAGVGLPDSLMMRGVYPLVRKPPITPGQEVCGTVVMTAEGSRFSVGDRVLGPTHFYAGSGGFATHTYVTEAHASLAPASLSDEEAAGFYIGYRTAYTTLVTRSAVQAGETVLVLGGSGSTGATAILLAKALGARVVAVASTEAKRSFCAGLGADVTVDRDIDAIRSAMDDHTEGRGFDVVVDPVGGELASAALSTVARYGRFAIVGFASGSWVTVDPIDAVMRNYSVVGVLAAGFTAEENARDIADLYRLAEAGSLPTPIGEVAELADVPRVIESLGTSAPPGKLVVRGATG